MSKRHWLGLIRRILKKMNLTILRDSTYQNLVLDLNRSVSDSFLEILKISSKQNGVNLDEFLPHSKSQIKQDIFTLTVLAGRENGYFVEFGATDGMYLSNTFLLEKRFNWTGILAEPGKNWHKSLSENRTAHLEFSCISSKSGDTLTFQECENPNLSTTSKFISTDNRRRKIKRSYEVQTISLIDLLLKYKAPSIIDYLSIDTEGSEYEILKTFDFQKYKFRVITCEHNYNEEVRSKIHNLLTQAGYERVWKNLTRCDDFYINPELIHLKSFASSSEI